MARNNVGSSKERLYSIWRGIKQRCNNTNDKSYRNYGARGITVQKSWQASNGYILFREYLLRVAESQGILAEVILGVKGVGEAITSQGVVGYICPYSLDRIDNDKGYFEGNLRWATRSQQERNKRGNIATRGLPTGIQWHKTYQVFRARTKYNGKEVTIGQSKCLITAYAMRLRWERENLPMA